MNIKEKVRKIISRVKLSFTVQTDLIQLFKEKENPEFSFKEYIKKYEEKEAQFLVWLLEMVNLENQKILPNIKWTTQEVKKVKNEQFVRDHVSEEVIKRYHLL